MTSYVRVSGPIFDGRAQAAAQQWARDTEATLAHQAEAIIKAKAAKMNRSGRGGSGAAAGAVHALPAGSSWLVEGTSEKGSVWWPWLEGTSRRNRGNSFGGYHVFRLAARIVAKRARAVAQAQLDAVIDQMGGE
jgi:hypothetical protein